MTITRRALTRRVTQTTFRYHFRIHLTSHLHVSSTPAHLSRSPKQTEQDYEKCENMNYELATKKRKFHQILDTISGAHHAPSPPLPRPPSAAIPTVPKRRRATPPKVVRPAASAETLRRAYLPASRAGYLARLATFRDVSVWRVASTSAVHAGRWAGRGWECVGVGVVGCAGCGARVVVDLSPAVGSGAGGGVAEQEEKEGGGGGGGEKEQTTERDEREAEAEADDLEQAVLRALVQRYSGMIVTAHAAPCPWRKRGCDGSIQRIEGLLNASHVFESVKERYKAIRENVLDVPAVSGLPLDDDPGITSLNSSVSDMTAAVAAELSNDKSEIAVADENILRLALCGWTYKYPGTDTDVIECNHCFRSLGLWLYRGATPTVERLDPVESHLEYCPYRSAEAQDTEIVVAANVSASGPGSGPGQSSRRVKVPGWLATYRGLARYLQRQGGREVGGAGASVTTSTSLDGYDRGSERELDRDSHEADEQEKQSESPEQVDRKVRDLISRIREARKPFNVKALLNRRKRSAVVI